MGKRLFVAVIENSAAETVSALATLPVEVCRVPVSRIVRCPNEEELVAVRARLGEFDWLLFASANAATIFFDLLKIPSRARLPRIACIGPNTADCVANLGHRVDFVSAEHSGDSFGDEFARAHGSASTTLLLPRPEKMGSALVERLLQSGTHVTELILYRTEPIAADCLPALELNPADLFVFLSPSGVRHFCQRYAVSHGADVFAMGGATARALLELGYKNIHTAESSSREGLVDAIRAFLDNRSKREE